MSLPERIAAVAKKPCLVCGVSGEPGYVGVYVPNGRGKLVAYQLCEPCWRERVEGRQEAWQSEVEVLVDGYPNGLQ